jgi:adenosylmethionine-8-amino-7-oxononanoate aminotransferase
VSAFIVLGTDTDAGKTTFSLLWLARFAPECAYWKPVEAGPSDSDIVRRLVPATLVHPPVLRLSEPVAPPLAARREAVAIPTAEQLAAAGPLAEDLVIETFGGPFSPLNETESQIKFVERLRVPTVLVGPSTLGAIGRTLAMLHALRAHGVTPAAVVLIGPADQYAEDELRKHWPKGLVFGLRSPESWSAEGIAQAAAAQDEALNAIRAALVPPRDDADWVAADRRYVWHPYTSLEDPDAPLPVVGAEAEFLELADGRRVIDAIASWWTIQHGHRHPPLIRALHEASGRIDHVLFAGATHPWAARLAEALLATAPWDGGRVFYSDNGSTAVEVALKLAYQYWCRHGEPARTTFVGFEHGYHGDTFGAMAVSRDPVFFGTFEPLLFHAEILPLDPAVLDDWLKQHARQTAGVIIEPLVQGAGGMRFHSEAALRDLAGVARRHGVLFIADEVMTGLGRLGPFWAHSAAGVFPDLIATAKTIAGGLLPLAATLVAPHIEAEFRTSDRRHTFFHGHSFTAHPLACAVALANLELLREAIPDTPRRFEAFWRESLEPLRSRPGVRDLRCCGTIATVELDLAGGYLADASRTMRLAALERDVLLRPLGNVIYAMPPWCCGLESLARIAEAMTAAVDAALPGKS